MDDKKKARAYDEALNKIKPLYEQAKRDDNPIWSTYEYLFPQLTESEDERIINTLYYLCKEHDWLNGATKEQCLAYLERQKTNSDVELSPEDYKLIPQELISVCNDIIAGRPVLLCADKTGAGKLRTWLKQLIEKQKEQRKETLRDFIDNFPYSDEQKEQNLNPSKSVGLKEQKSAQTVDEKEYIRAIKSLITDFVRETEPKDVAFYQRIYDWLDGRHIEQSVERQDYSGLSDLERAIHRGFLAAGVENAPVGIIKETAQECIAHIDKSAEWAELQSEFKNINEAFEDGKKEVIAHPEKYDLCKPAEWSEEDEEMLNSCISSIEESKENRYAYKENDGDTSYDREIAWLKFLSLSLKKRNEDVAKLCSNEWSEEDQLNLNWVIAILNGEPCDLDIQVESLIAWLKSLRPSWKPSEAQLMALHSIIDDESDTIGNEQLKLLYEQLKKLM